MKDEKCNILIYGILSSGSSALVDLLLEYNNVNVIPGEFDDFRAPGLVADQLCYDKSVDFSNLIDTLLQNTSKRRLIYNIFPIFKWKMDTITGIKGRFISSLIRIRQLFLLEKLNKELKSNISFEDKIRLANHWISDVGNINNKNKALNVYNQPIEIRNDDHIWRAVFNPCKLICVYRDPKDQLADIVKRGFLSVSFGGPYMTIAGLNSETIYGSNRRGAIKFHIDAMKKRFEWIDAMKEKLDPDKFLLIDFEGLVHNYDLYKSAIEDFIGGIKNNHKDKMKVFNPDISKENIGIYKNILSRDELDSLTEFDHWYKNMVVNNQISTKTSKIMSSSNI